MSEDSVPSPPPGGQFLVYQTPDGKLTIDVRFEGETAWLTQQHMAELFQTTKQNIGQHLKSIYAEGELVRDSVVKEFCTTPRGAQGDRGSVPLRASDFRRARRCHCLVRVLPAAGPEAGHGARAILPADRPAEGRPLFARDARRAGRFARPR